MKYFLLLLALTATLAATSCSYPLLLNIYNNTGVPIEIKTGVSSPLSIPPYESREIRPPANARLTVLMQRKEYTAHLVSGGFSPVYVVKPNIGFGNATAKLQLNPDMRLYVLNRNQQFPLHDLKHQPDGYPVPLNALGPLPHRTFFGSEYL